LILCRVSQREVGCRLGQRNSNDKFTHISHLPGMILCAWSLFSNALFCYAKCTINVMKLGLSLELISS